MILDTEKAWLQAKHEELSRQLMMFPNEHVVRWDLYRFLAIIENLSRELRRHKTALAAKKKEAL